MRTKVLVIVVVLAHIVAVGAIGLSQGCGRTVAPVSGGTGEVVLPPATSATETPVTPSHPLPPPPLVLEEPPAKSWPDQTTTYTVAKGETLSDIAHRYKLTVEELMALNSIKNKNMVRAGQKLILPGKVNVAAHPFRARTTTAKPVHKAAAAVPGAPAPAAASAGGTYAVKSGDSLWLIARRHNTTVAAIKQANNLTTESLKLGQKLVIPGAAAAAPAPAPAPIAPPPVVPMAPPPAPTGAPPADVPGAAPVTDVVPPPPSPAPVAPDAGGAAVTPPVAPAPVAGGENFKLYVVGENEDLYSVSLLWNVSVQKLKEINGLTDTTLKPGQRLKIPAAP